MKTTIKNYAAVAALAAVSSLLAEAQDSHWDGTVGNNLWNVATNWNPAGIPPSGNPVTTYQGNVWLDPSPVDGDNVITIPAADVETPGVGNTNEVYNTIFGPEFGCSLNVYGSLKYDWTMAPYQPDPTPGVRSLINIRDNGSISTTGASLNLGSGWWPVCEGTYCTMNLYSNAVFQSLGGAGLWSGGHINIYDQSLVLINGYVNLDNGQANNDGTTDFVLGGGTLKLPENMINVSINSGTVSNWVARGILRVYGKGFDTNDMVVSDNGTNTIVAGVPLGGSLQRVYFQPLPRSNVTVGTFQQAVLVGDYPSVSGVLLSSSEPGISPTSFPAPTYSSSNPNVATINNAGIVTALAPGSTTLSAVVGTFSSTNSVSLTVQPVLPNLIHRYSFKDAAGSTTAADSVGGSAWNATLAGDAALSGTNLLLSGNVGSSASLPAGILSGLDEVTIEAWVTFPGVINTNADLFAFGRTDETPFDPNIGAGMNYISFSPKSGTTMQANFAQGLPGNTGERDAVAAGVLDNQTNVHVVVVYHPLAGYEAFYINGVLKASVTMFNNMIDPVAFGGPTYTNHSILAFEMTRDPLADGLGSDPQNYIGRSVYDPTAYTGTVLNPGLLAQVNEFRIYSTPLTPSQIAADYALGPGQMLGTNVHVSLNASISNGNTMLKWPTTSALVTLMSSPALGAGAVWTPVNLPLGNDGNGHFQVSVPLGSGARYFRLQQ